MLPLITLYGLFPIDGKKQDWVNWFPRPTLKSLAEQGYLDCRMAVPVTARTIRARNNKDKHFLIVFPPDC